MRLKLWLRKAFGLVCDIEMFAAKRRTLERSLQDTLDTPTTCELAKAAFIQLDGKGARLFGGCWNSASQPEVYAAASPSLAVLGIPVHLGRPAELVPDCSIPPQNS